MKKYYALSLLPFAIFWVMVAPPRAQQSPAQIDVLPQSRTTAGILGQSKTLLPDGHWLILGGEGSQGMVDTAAIQDAATGAITTLSSHLLHARAWHTATVLPNGTVLVFGGVDSNGRVVATAELYDPPTKQFQPQDTPGLTPRAHHTATLLTDGTVFITGGLSDTGEILYSAESWNPQTSSGQELQRTLLTARRDQTATLFADGEVLLWGGLDGNGAAINYGELFDPKTSTFRLETTPVQPNNNAPQVEEFIPENGSENVSTTTMVAVRFSKPLLVTTVTSMTVTLSTSSAAVPVNIVAAEGGMLAFVTPESPLAPASTYAATLSGLTDSSGTSLSEISMSFTTEGDSTAAAAGIVSAGDSNSNQPVNTQAKVLPPLQGPAGVTALAGQSLKLDGSPLEDLAIEDEGSGVKAKTDETGRFLLLPLRAGHHVLFVDGRKARSAGQVYGTYEIGVDIAAGKTNVLNYKIWMTVLDTSHAVKIASPTTSDTVVTTPTLPGLELHIPKGTVITDHDGKVVREISITPIPTAQPPFPLPNVKVPLYFTIQPGAAYISVNGGWGPQGAQLYYPNSHNAAPGTPFNFWNYDPDNKGWYVYGEGKVAVDGMEVIPDPGVVIYEFTGAMVESPTNRAGTFPRPGGPVPPVGDPVDLGTGLFVYTKTDLVVNDVLPITLKRTYRQADSISRAFGVGSMHSYDIYLVGDVSPYTYQELVLPDGGVIRYNRISSGTDYTTAVYLHSSTATIYYGSKIAWNGGGWNLTLKDGTVYVFPDGFSGTKPQQAALNSITDRYGNTITITRDSNYNATQITSPNGRWIQFTYDSSNRITQAKNNIGQTVTYTYDSGGRLSAVTDAKGGVTTYTYDSNANMLTITDPRGLTYLTNQYDSNNRVIKQVSADGSAYQFSYTLTTSSTESHYVTESGSYSGAGPALDVSGFRACEGCSEGYAAQIAQIDVTDPRGYVRRVIFGSNGYPTSDTRALGQPEEQTTTYEYFPDNLLESTTDSLDRTSSFVYDVNNNLTQVTQLSGTANAITTTYTYEPTFNQRTSVTDPLNHTTSFAYDSNGNLVTVTDPLNHQTTFTYNAAGQPLTATDATNNQTNFAYDSGDLVSTTDPLSRTLTRFLDNAGRLLSVTNPLGQTTRNAYDGLNEITSVTDPAGNVTSFSYDGNGNLLTVTDANSHTTTYNYDTMDRISTRTDPLGNAEAYQYDAAGNLTQVTDRRGKIASYTYDGQNRRTFAGFGMASGTPPTYESSIGYSYDSGNRIASVVDSAAGTITPKYDQLDRLISEQTAQGTVSYDYDPAGRRTTMTVAGQTFVSYTYDNANRLTQIAQGSATVSLAYDPANRRTSVTLPNGIVMSYSFDNGSQLTGISYTNGSTNLGSLTYSYDLAGRRTSMGGSLAQTALPLPISEAEYNANNQLTEWGTASLYYDLNGNMTSDGVNSYSWNSRNQLGSMNLSADSFTYDGYGRRVGKTISSTTTNYLYDGTNTVQELSGGSVTANLLTGLGIDERFTRTDSSGTANFLRDALGSTLELTNSSGSALAQYSYEPFGNTFVMSGISANTYEYTGRENDGTGVYFYRSRYYSPTLQRFIAEDPIGIAGGTNLYVYVGNDPILLTDPTGRCPACIAMGIGALIGGAVAGYQAYANGASASNVIAAAALGAGTGAVAVVAATYVATVAAAAGSGAIVAGAAGGAAGGAITGIVNGINGVVSQTESALTAAEKALVDTAVGAGAGMVGAMDAGTVQGGENFKPFTSPNMSGPMAQQLYQSTGASGIVGAVVCSLAGRKC
jgi:RHS repeat-associated protein